ncbi:MAG: hypothetical protein ACRDMV_03910 [Streptosporangiales bacterium]
MTAPRTANPERRRVLQTFVDRLGEHGLLEGQFTKQIDPDGKIVESLISFAVADLMDAELAAAKAVVS